MVYKKGRIPWNKGKPMSEECKEKVKNNARINPDYGMKGKKHSNSTKIKIARKAIGREHSLKTRNKMSLAKKGMPHSKEHNLKVSLALKGKKKSKEHTKKIREITRDRQSGKSFEQIFGKEKADKIKEKLSKRTKGKNNPRWLGGKSFEPYDRNFNLNFKNVVRKRDNQICMVCGIHREKLSRALDVHHVNYDKKLSIIQNCIGLCFSCHSKTNVNRKHWTKFFQSLLSEKYGYCYSNNSEPIINLNMGLNNAK